jgi:hypothetical protein
MISLVLLACIFGLLFVMAYTTHRRFGVLGLALAAGALLSANWTGTLTPFIEQQGVVLSSPPLIVVVETVLILLPALVLLFNGPAYAGRWPQIGGAFAFAALGFVLLAKPLTNVLMLDGMSQPFMAAVVRYSSVLIVIGIIGAIIDMLITTRGKSKKREH